MIQPSYADDQMSAIQMDLLNDDCEIVDDDNFSVNFPENGHEDSLHTFLDQSQNSISGEMSTEISGAIDDLSSDNEQLRYFFLLNPLKKRMRIAMNWISIWIFLFSQRRIVASESR